MRIELFDDEIDQMGLFDIMTQRKIENVSSVTITPAREIVYGAKKRGEIRTAVKNQLAKAKDDRVRGELSAELETIDAGLELPFIDKYMSIVYPEHATLADYAADAASRCELKYPLIFVQESVACSERMKAYAEEFPYCLVARDQLEYGYAELSTYNQAEVQKAIDDAISYVMTDQKDVKSALDEAQTTAENILKAYK